MTADLIGDREKLRDAEERIRAGLVAFAEHLLGKATAEQVVAAFCPADVNPQYQKTAFADLLHVLDTRGPDHTDLPFHGQEDLDYMTGTRR